MVSLRYHVPTGHSAGLQGKVNKLDRAGRI